MNPRKATNRTIEVKVRINCSQGVQVSFIEPLEISLDCPTCLKLGRTVLFTTSEETVTEWPSTWPTKTFVSLTLDSPLCTSRDMSHVFPGRVMKKQVAETEDGLPMVIFSVCYLFRPFTNRKYEKDYEA